MKISIITPNYNYANYLPSCLESVLNQDFKNFEFIIVDDGSTDESISIIKRYAEIYSDKIKLIQQSNQGQTYALNIALKAVSGDIICWLNSDDMFCDKIFSCIIRIFNEYPSIDAVFGDIYIINSKGEKLKLIKYLPFDYISGIFNGFGKIIPSNGIFWKSDLSKQINFMNPSMHFAMDSEYWSRLLFKKKVIHADIPIACFRYHENAKTIKRKIKNSAEYLEAKMEDELVAKQSYSRLYLSRIIPYRYTFIIRFYYKLRRHLSKFLNGHYLI